MRFRDARDVVAHEAFADRTPAELGQRLGYAKLGATRSSPCSARSQAAAARASVRALALLTASDLEGIEAAVLANAVAGDGYQARPTADLDSERP